MVIRRHGWLAGVTALLGVVALAGCGGGNDVQCGAGTMKVGQVCVANNPGRDAGMMMPPPGTDSGMVMPGTDSGTITPPPPPPTDSGPVTPPDDGAMPPPPPPPPPTDGAMPPPPPPSDAGMVMTCADAATCATWSHQLVDLINARRTMTGECMGAQIMWDDRVSAVALQNSMAMATGDSLVGIDMLFPTVEASVGMIYDGAAAFSGTRLGAEDVLNRWLMRADIAADLAKCNLTNAGVGFATNVGGSGVSYGTLIIVDLVP